MMMMSMFHNHTEEKTQNHRPKFKVEKRGKENCLKTESPDLNNYHYTARHHHHKDPFSRFPSLLQLTRRTETEIDTEMHWYDDQS